MYTDKYAEQNSALGATFVFLVVKKVVNILTTKHTEVFTKYTDKYAEQNSALGVTFVFPVVKKVVNILTTEVTVVS